jgi:hypothetical protein
MNSKNRIGMEYFETEGEKHELYQWIKNKEEGK